MSRAAADWMTPAVDMIASRDGKGGFILTFPEYRPDLAKALAQRLGLAYHDLRAEDLKRHGTAAGTLSLDWLDEVLSGVAQSGGAVVFNVESLLATKPPAERAAWLAAFAGAYWPVPLVVPVTLFADEMDPMSEGVYCFDAAVLPPQTMISRFLH